MNFTYNIADVTINLSKVQGLQTRIEKIKIVGGMAMELSDQVVEKSIELFIKNYFRFRGKLPYEDVIKNIPDEKLEQIEKIEIPVKGRALEEVVNEMEEVFQYGYNVNHSRYFGFIPGPSGMLSWLGDIMTSAYNRHAGSFLTFPAGEVIEKNLIEWLCEKAGFDNSASGLFVSGGSMANMTALIIARDTMLAAKDWGRGVAYVSDQTHSSVAKGLRIIGIDDSRIRCITTDEEFRMDTEELEMTIKADKQAGLIPFVVVASAGSTNTGSIDPFEKISEICKKYNLWMHADGAFGASVILSKQHKGLLKGIELSDSISWDAHKWLFQTYACGIVLVKDRQKMLNSFSVHPEYLQDLEQGVESFNPWDMGMELTRPARGMKLWITLQAMGSDAVADAVDHGFSVAEWAEDELKKNKDVEFISHAHMAIVNFRYNPENYTEEEKDQLNHMISQKIVDSGYAGIFTTVLNGKTVLRICALHPETTEKEIRDVIRKLEEYYEETVDKTGGQCYGK